MQDAIPQEQLFDTHPESSLDFETVRAAARQKYERPFLVLDIDCATGTYVRSLVDDLGQALGCGAHVHALRRTWAAPSSGRPA